MWKVEGAVEDDEITELHASDTSVTNEKSMDGPQSENSQIDISTDISSEARDNTRTSIDLSAQNDGYANAGKIYSILNDLKDDIRINDTPRRSRLTDRTEYREFVSNGKLFIQRNDNFAETTSGEILGVGTIVRVEKKNNQLDIDCAITIQRNSHTIANLCYGFLGGISLMQLVLTYTLVSGSRHELLSFIQLYSKIAEVPTASFSILTTVCFVFSCDRLDPLKLNKNVKQKKIRCNHWMLFLIYGVMLILSILCFAYDEMIILYPTAKGQMHPTRELQIWRSLNLWRCVFGIAGWILICIAEPVDLLEQYLLYLKKQYEDRRSEKN